MFLIKPILIVLGKNEWRLFKMMSRSGYFDVAYPFNYQKIHTNIIVNYVSWNLLDMCPIEKTYEETLRRIKQARYKKKFLFLLVSFIKENNTYSPDDFREWLKDKQNKLLKFFNRPGIYSLYNNHRMYNTILVDLDYGEGNRWNRFYNLPPNLYRDSTLKEFCFNHLIDGGEVRFIGGNYGRRVSIADPNKYLEITETKFEKDYSPDYNYQEADMGL